MPCEMFSFCFFHSSSSDDDGDVRHPDLEDLKALITVTPPQSPNHHDLSTLLYTPDLYDGLKAGSLLLSPMASPIGTTSSPKEMTRNNLSSSSLVTQGPSPDRPSAVREYMKFEETIKCSYNVSTLNRINLLESVTKQTLALSSKSQSSLQTHLSGSQSFRDVRCRFEKLNRRIEHLKHVVNVSNQKLNTVKERRAAFTAQISERREEMEERIQLLRSMIGSLNVKRNELDQEKIKLFKCRKQLETKRAEFLLHLSSIIYPIEIPQSPLKAVVSNGRTTLKSCSINIAGFSLPNSTTLSPKHSSFWGNSSSTASLSSTSGKERREDIDEQSCIAIGCVAHILLILSRLSDIPLKYDIEYCGSRSLIVDHLNNEMLNTFYVQSSWRTSDDIETDERKVRRNQGVKVTLYLKNKGSKDSRVYFKYGLYLVSQVVAQLSWTLDFVALRNTSSCDVPLKNFIPNQRIEISNTLINLNQLINNYIKSYPVDPKDKCLLTGDDTCPSDETFAYLEARSMVEANDLEEIKAASNHVHNNPETSSIKD